MIVCKMLEILLRRQFYPVSVRCISVTLKFSYCDSSLVKPTLNIKSLVENDFSRVVKKNFQKNFIENLFINKIQADIFEYPQVDTIEEIETLAQCCDFAQKLITDKTETKTENALCEKNSKKAVSTLKEHQLTGFKIPRVKNGFGFLSSEYSYMHEKLGVDPSLLKTVCENEDFGVQLIDSFGSDLQKEQYLRKLISGENLSSFAHLESGTFIPFGENSLTTNAVLSSDGQGYIISGTKTWVYNANFADLIIVSANIKSSEGKEESKPTLFLVHRNTPGVVIHEPIETLGMKNLNICDITFNEVVVPTSSVLGNINEGGEIIKKVLCNGKLNIGGQCLALMKKLVDKCIKHCIFNEFFNKEKYKMDSFRIKIGQMATRIYLVESMTYLLTGRIDSHNDPDVFLESLIVKIFASESLQFILKEALGLLGDECLSDDESLSEIFKDSQFYIACDDTNDHLRLVLASAGLKYAMEYKGNPAEIFSRFLNSIRLSKILERNKKVVHKDELEGYLHLMFQKEAWILEDSVDILYECTKHLISKYGKNVFHKYFELKYLADLVINIYAMTATLGRASRAYCLALKFHEVDRASTDTEIRRLGLQNRKSKLLLKKLDAFSDFSEISSAMLNSNKYSELYPVIKKKTAQSQKHVASIKQ